MMRRSLSFLLLLIIASAAADCPPGTKYEPTFNKCYQFFNTPLAFLSAEQKCNSIGGHLVSIKNSYESTYVAGLVSGSAARTPNYWIGASLLRSSLWTWTDSSSMAYANWASGQPISSNHCGLIRDLDSKWITGACNSLLPFVCAVDPDSPLTGYCPTQTSLPTSTPSTGSNDTFCSPGYTLYSENGLCYKYFRDQKNYNSANNTCAEDGGMLASSTTPHLNQFLTALPKINCEAGTCPYIGLVCTSSSLDSCSWADGSDLGGYANFYWGAPSSKMYAYSIVAALNTTVDQDLGQWEPSHDARAFLCQKPSTKRPLYMQSTSEKNEEQRKGRTDARRMSSAVYNN